MRFCHRQEIGTSTLLYETKRSSDALKDPRIRRAVSTLVYATPLHSAQGDLPVNLHPPNSAVLGKGGLAAQVRAGGGHAGADSTVNMITNEAALLGPQGHGHPLGCRYLHLLGDAPQRHRGPHLGASSSVRWSSALAAARGAAHTRRLERWRGRGAALAAALGAARACRHALGQRQRGASLATTCGASLFGACLAVCRPSPGPRCMHREGACRHTRGGATVVLPVD